MANTTIPAGLTIARNGMKFTFGWKITAKDHDGGQQIQWRTNLTAPGKWLPSNTASLPITNRATSKTVTLTMDDYWPNPEKKFLETVSFRIRGKRAPYEEGTGDARHTVTPGWSEWARKDYKVKLPPKPSGSAEWIESGEKAGMTRFSWAAKNDAKNNQPFHSVEWWSVLLANSNITDGSKIKFGSYSSATHGTDSHASGSIIPDEDFSMLRTGSHTRWVKFRSRGPRGGSGWKYLEHVYAYPNKPLIIKVENSESNGNVTLNMVWEVKDNPGRPIDKTTIEYFIGTPAAGRTVPTGASWTEARVQSDSKYTKEGARIVISEAPGVDECMWTRVVCTHDENSTPSNNWFVRGKALSPPVDVAADPSSGLVTITASNESEVPDSQLAVIMRTDKDPDSDIIIGIIPHGSGSGQFAIPEVASSVSVGFGVYAFQGEAKGSTIDGVTTYAVTANMKSPVVWKGGSVPTAPENFTASISPDTSGEAVLEWDWTWQQANATEISWSQNPNAWESTDEPDIYLISNHNQPRWRVSGLETGVRWYFRARFAVESADDYNYGPYSDTAILDLTSAPAIPVLELSKAVIAAGESFTASWAYTTTDGTAQAYAEICEASYVDGEIVYGDVIAHETTAQHSDITPSWQTGTSHNLCVRVTSASGHVSDGWSSPVSILVADPVTCEITQVSIPEEIIADSDGVERTVNSLKTLPITITAEGAGDTGQTTVIIERADEYHMMRPDERTMDGYDGETIAILRQYGEAQMTITQGDLIGSLDDGAPYRIIATAEDEYGQTASDELEFEVHWTHQPEIPEVSAVIDNGVAKITATVPELYTAGDVIDIYRLSADAPEIIIKNGEYGTVYVDPYPTIGESGGHRIVARTANGDYITEDGQPAWTDLTSDDGDYIDEYSIIIDFDGRQAILPYDLNLSNKWSKDFRLTNYLGGSQQGDWNEAVSRTATLTANLIADFDADTIEDMRALSRYSGICHVRTPDGSSFAADVQVSETKNYSNWDMVGFTLTVTKIDPERLDGMTLEEWTGGLE